MMILLWKMSQGFYNFVGAYDKFGLPHMPDSLRAQIASRSIPTEEELKHVHNRYLIQVFEDKGKAFPDSQFTHWKSHEISGNAAAEFLLNLWY